MFHACTAHCRILTFRSHSDTLPCAVFAVLPPVAQAKPAGAIMTNRPRVSNGRGWPADNLHLATDGLDYGLRFTGNGSRLALMTGETPSSVCNRQSGIYIGL
jgi:hypothetical protein